MHGMRVNIDNRTTFINIGTLFTLIAKVSVSTRDFFLKLLLLFIKIKENNSAAKNRLPGVKKTALKCAWNNNAIRATKSHYSIYFP